MKHDSVWRDSCNQFRRGHKEKVWSSITAVGKKVKEKLHDYLGAFIDTVLYSDDFTIYRFLAMINDDSKKMLTRSEFQEIRGGNIEEYAKFLIELSASVV